MKPASCNVPTSSTIAQSRSWANTRLFCRMGGKEGDTFSLCTVTEGLIPGMSSWLQANTSWFILRKVMSARRTIELARVPILMVRSSLEPSRGISSSLSTSSAIVRCSSIFMVCRWSLEPIALCQSSSARMLASIRCQLSCHCQPEPSVYCSHLLEC